VSALLDLVSTLRVAIVLAVYLCLIILLLIGIHRLLAFFLALIILLVLPDPVSDPVLVLLQFSLQVLVLSIFFVFFLDLVGSLSYEFL
jgi:hypothetical protein